MDHTVVTDSDIITDNGRKTVIYMDGTVILDITSLANSDGRLITADNGIIEHTWVCTDGDTAENNGLTGNVSLWWNI